MANVVVEYRDPGSETWSRVIAAPGESYEEAVEALKRRWPEIECRRYVALCVHGVDLWEPCLGCQRGTHSADTVLGNVG